MSDTGLIGPVSTTASQSGTQVIRLGNMCDVITSELHGRYYESTYRKTSFTGSMQAVLATAVQTGLTTSATGGLILYNPFGNLFNLVLNKVGIALIVAQTSAGAIGLAGGYSPTAPTGGSTVTPISDNLGLNANPTGVCWSAAAVTLPTTPVVKRILGYVGTGAITVNQFVGGVIDLEGGLILPPGGYVQFYASAGLLASSYMFSATWEEVPV